MTQKVFFFVAAILFFGFLFGRSYIFDALQNRPPETSKKSIDTKIITSTDAFSVGPADAKVTVVEFYDYQCPFSLQVAPVVEQLMDAYKDKSVRFQFRHLPIIAIHPYALPAARATLCAKEQGKFLSMHTTIFNNQNTLSPASPYEFSQKIGLNLRSFNTCLTSDKYNSTIEKDYQDAIELGITGTPTFFINDKKIVGAASYEELKEAIDSELVGKLYKETGKDLQKYSPLSQ